MGWQKTRVFICSWRKPKYPRQQLCCRYYCLISPSPGGISGSLPDDGWNHPSLRYESTGLSGSCCLCTLSANHPTQQSHEEAAAEARHHTLSLLTAAWLSDTSSVGPRRCKSRGGGGDVATTSLWSGKICQSSGWSPPSSSLTCNQPCVASAAN